MAYLLGIVAFILFLAAFAYFCERFGLLYGIAGLVVLGILIGIVLG